MTPKPFVIIDAPQRTPAWFAARCGRLTGSVAGDMLAVTKKSGEAAARRDLRLRLALEQLTGQPQDGDGYVSADMRRGTDLEPAARVAFEAASGLLVQQAGFLQHRELSIGYSPDGYLGDFDGLIELKVPRSATHWHYLRTGGLPAEHAPQVMHGLLVSGARFCEFASWDPRFPPALRLFRVRVDRTALDLSGYELALRLFLKEVAAELADVTRFAELVGVC